MKYTTLIMTVAAVAFATPVYAKSLAEEQQDVRDKKAAIAKDNEAIAKQDENIAVNRAEKAEAKAKGNIADQASQSVQIGANKTAKEAHEMKKSMDEKSLEKQKKDVSEAEGKHSNHSASAKNTDPTHTAEDIAEQKENLRVNRAEKAEAMKRGDKMDQASQSVQIGANKMAIAGEKADRERAMKEESPAAGTPKEGPAANK